jgi:hypothetical protein
MAIGEVTGDKINVNVVPVNRGVSLIIVGQADFYGPALELKDEKKISELKYVFSTSYIYKSTWVLYVNKNKNVDVSKLKDGKLTDLKIEADITIANHYFNFPIKASRNISDSLKKVEEDTIDGFIYVQTPTDIILRKSGFKNIKRIYFDTYNGKFVIVKNSKTKEIDAMLTKGIEILKKNGRYNDIMSIFISDGKYIDWQP